MKSSLKVKWAAGALLLLAALWSGPALAGGVVETRLDNGLTVLMKESHAAPVFTAQIWFRVGSRNETNGITGISHMLEHMQFNSSRSFKKGEISKMVRERGGIDNAATSTDYTYYWELLSSEHLEFALRTLAEKVGGALLLDDEFQTERTVVLSELEGRENDPGSLLYQEVCAAAFKCHPYRWPIIGWRSDVENVTREQLEDYYHTHYQPNNATLVLVGDFDPARALELVKKYFGGLPAGKLPPEPYTSEPEQRGMRTVTLSRQGGAERVMMAYHIPGLEHPDTYALIVLDQILSGGRASRLYRSLVETELATSAWSSCASRRDPSLFLLGATARQGVGADEIEKALLEQVRIARTTLPTEEEMQAARNQLEAYLVFQNDSVSDQGELLGYYNTVASWRYIDSLIPSIKSVTAEEVETAAAKYLVEDNLTVGRFIPTEKSDVGREQPPGGPAHYSDGGPGSFGQAGSAEDTAVVQSAFQSDLVRPYRTVLDNGMVVIVQENHSNPTVAVRGRVRAGGCFDPAGKYGTASLVAEMLGRGTRHRSALQIAQEIEFVGASLEASADVEYAEFGGKSLTKDFSLLMDVLSDELMNSDFPEDQFQKAKGEMLSELARSKESPAAQALRAFHNSVFPVGHAYHQPLIDDAREQVSSITRQDLVEFHKRCYRPDTTIISIVGDVDAEEAVRTVEKYFGQWTAEGGAPEADIPMVEPQGGPSRMVIPMADKSEVDVVFGHALGIRRDNPDYYAVRIMNNILGGSGALASLLGKVIREENGLVYNVYSTFESGLGAGPWYAVLGTSPKSADAAVEALRQEIARFKEEGATQEEFERAREFIVGVFPIALETNEGISRALLNAEFYGLGMDYLRNYAGIYRSVTLEQVNAAAKKYLHPEAAVLVIAGPYDHNGGEAAD